MNAEIDAAPEIDAPPTDAPPLPPNAFRRTIAINPPTLSAAVANAPIAIELAGDVDYMANGADGGTDILFTLADDTPLDAEIVSVDRAAGDLLAWVKLPSLPAEGASIRLYYGNGRTAPTSANPWTDLADLVWHLDSIDTATTPDSSPSGSTADVVDDQLQPTDPALQACVQGDCFDFERDIVFIDDATVLERGTNSFSLSLWFAQEEAVGGEDLVWFKGGLDSGTEGYALLLGTASWRVRISDANDNTATLIYGTETDLGGGELVHLVMVVDRDADELRAYLNGAPTDSAGGALTPVDISGIGSLDNNFQARVGSDVRQIDGQVDEVMAFPSAISADFVAVLHANGATAGFLTIGAEESADYPE